MNFEVLSTGFVDSSVGRMFQPISTWASVFPCNSWRAGCLFVWCADILVALVRSGSKT